MDLLKLQIKQF